MTAKTATRFDALMARAFARELEAGLVFDTTLVCRPSGERSPLREQLPEEDIAHLIRETLEGRTLDRGGGLVPGTATCAAARTIARVTPSGELTPCVAIPRSAGSLRGAPFRELWESGLFRRLRAMRLEDLPECRGCPLRDRCVRCPGLALVEGGRLDGPSSSACRMARVFALAARVEG